ncbi:MAG TPA: hypothetical protein VMP11_05650 [Verrucomicrobiae bacterium]|nr:hypothetical protein [Verrucomicrobiae bacterium]
MDTVAEAAWGLHFWDNRIDFEVGKKLDPTYAQSTDSDFCVHRRGKTYWLDVLNVDLNQQAGQPGGASNAGVRERATLRTITSILVQRAERKFKKKFAAKRERKTLKDTSAGILLSIQSSLMAVMSPLRSNADELCISNESPLVRGMFKNFEKNVPSFSLVLIHWLGDFDCSGTLRPGHIVAWQPDDDHSFDWLFKTIPRLDKGFKVIQSAKRCR